MAKIVTLKDKDDVTLYPQVSIESLTGQVDESPIAESENLVRSAGVFTQVINTKKELYSSDHFSLQKVATGTVGEVVSVSQSGYEGNSYIALKVHEGDTLVVNTTGKQGDAPAYLLTDVDLYVISVSAAEQATEETITIDSDGYLYLNIGTATEYVAIKVVDQTVQKNTDDIERIDLKTRIDDVRLNGGSLTVTNQDMPHNKFSRWINNNGVVSTVDSGVLNRVESINISDIDTIQLTTTLSYAESDAAYLCDAQGNILYTVEKATDPISETIQVPTGATALYINYASSCSLQVTSNGTITALKGMIVELVSLAATDQTANITAIGESYYNTDSNKICTCIDPSVPSFDRKTPSDGVVYMCNDMLYIYDGTTLVSKVSEQVIPLVAFSDTPPTGITKGQYYYNTSTKKVYQNNGGGIYNNHPLSKTDSFLFLYNDSLYLWKNGELACANYDTIMNDVTPYLARAKRDNTDALPMVATAFETGNINSSTGENAQDSTVYLIRTKTYFDFVGGENYTYSVNEGYKIDVHYYTSDKSYLGHTDWREGSGTLLSESRTEYIRVVLFDTSYNPISFEETGASIIPSKKNIIVRAAAEESIGELTEDAMKNFFSLELPILAPSPQLPANGTTNSDFNAETMTSTQLQTAFEDLIENLSIPEKYFYPNNPKYGTLYETIVKDASGLYDIKAYVFTRRNRYAWRASAALFAWKAGATLYYTEHRSPLVGDVVYSDSSRTISGYTVSAYNCSTESITVNGATYTRDDSAKIASVEIFTRVGIGSSTETVSVYDKQDVSVGTASVNSSTELILNGVTYTRHTTSDYHTDNRATIVLWGNEHGPQSDPNEASIILYRLAKDLCHGCGNQFITFLHNYCKIVLIPVANPYGVSEYAGPNHRYGRNNYNNVNINRNYDTPGWAVVEDSDKGSYAGDQPETQFIMNTTLDVEADLAIDIHVLGYVGEGSEGRCHYAGYTSPINSKVREVMRDYCGLGYSSYGGAEPESASSGDDWIYSVGIAGGLIEMNPGPYAIEYDGKQHTAEVMFSCYTLLLNTLRMWYYNHDSSLDLSKLSIR